MWGLPSSCGWISGFWVGLASSPLLPGCRGGVGGWLICPGKDALGLSKNSAPRSGTSSAEGDFVLSKWLPWGLWPLSREPREVETSYLGPLQPSGCEAGRDVMQEPGQWSPLPLAQWPEGSEALTLKCLPSPRPQPFLPAAEPAVHSAPQASLCRPD